MRSSSFTVLDYILLIEKTLKECVFIKYMTANLNIYLVIHVTWEESCKSLG